MVAAAEVSPLALAPIRHHWSMLMAAPSSASQRSLTSWALRLERSPTGILGKAMAMNSLAVSRSTASPRNSSCS
jgi:hypothetical protein